MNWEQIALTITFLSGLGGVLKNENENIKWWFTRPKGFDYLAIFFLLVGFVVGLIAIYNNGEKEEEEKAIAQKRYEESIENNERLHYDNQVLQAKLEEANKELNDTITYSKGVINDSISAFKNSWFAMAFKEVQDKMTSEKAHHDNIKANLKIELGLNLELINVLLTKDLIALKDSSSWIAGRYLYDDLVISQSLLLSRDLKIRIKDAIETMKMCNRASELILQLEPGYERGENIKLFVKILPSLKELLTYINDNIDGQNI